MDAITELFAKHSRRLTMLAMVILVIAMSLSVARAVVFLVENMNDALLPTVVAPVTKAPTAIATGIARLNLFGAVEQRAQTRVVDAPQTSLNLELQGVFRAENPDDSTAIVGERNKTGELFQIGDRLPGNAILDAVFDDHILIKRGDRIEKLLFSDAPPSTSSQAASRQTYIPPEEPSARGEEPSTRLETIRERIAARRLSAPPTAPINGQPPANEIRQAIQTYRDRLSIDPEGVLSELGMAPVAASEASGYRVSGNTQLLSQSGLQEGDVILSVNGTPVGNVGHDQAMIDQTLAAGRVRIEVQRDERKFYLTLPIP